MYRFGAFIFLMSLSSCTTSNCDNVLEQEPCFAKKGNKCSEQEIEKDFEILKTCGGLEPQDEFLLRKEIIGSIMVQLLSDGHSITYGNIIAQINLIKTRDSYEEVRTVFEAENQIKNIRVDLTTFETVVPILIQGRFPESEIEQFRAFIIQKNLEGEYYEKALMLWKEEKSSKQIQNFESIKFEFLEDMSKVIKRANEQNKPIFIFFTGYTCLNCVKIEDNILANISVSKVLNEEFLCYVAYVDDKKKMDGTHQSRGMLQAKIQEEYFQSKSQPSLYILNSKGKIISELNEVPSVDEFLKWLKTCK